MNHLKLADLNILLKLRYYMNASTVVVYDGNPVCKQ
jgi:hypothetical protein